MKYLILIFCFVGCANHPSTDSTASAVNPTAAPARLIAFGDSYTSMPGSFAWQLGPALGLEEDNLAVPGTAIQYDAQIGTILRTQLNPQDVVVYLVGINDMRGYGDAPDIMALVKQDLELAIQHFCEGNVRAYIGTTPAMLSDSAAAITANHNATPAMALEYANAIKEVVSFYQGCETNDPTNARIHLVDVNALYTPTDSNTLSDLVHPNPAGHTELLNIFLGVIQQ